MKRVAVLGGGPAGAFAAERLASAGLDTVVLDEKLAWEKPCGGALTYKAYSQYPFLIQNSTPKRLITDTCLSAPQAGSVRMRLNQPMVIYSRLELNRMLLERAERAGARIEQERIVEVARRTGRIPSGDTACGFGNTAMVLAEKGFIPKLFAALVRVISVVRTLVAVEEGAKGPDKDCGYEGPYLKAITGIPISMEGKTAACAHSSPVGNVAAACADLWSNESVQNVKLLGGFAPTVYLEQLEYDARFINRAIRDGADTARKVQELLVESDVHLDPQAFVLAPRNVVTIAGEMVKARTHVEAARRGALRALDLIEAAVKDGSLLSSEQEKEWIPRLRDELGEIPDDESAFVEMMLPALDLTKTIPSEYGL